MECHESMRDGVYVMMLFIKVVDDLINIRVDNKNIYIETQSGKLYNFRAVDFRRRLGELLPRDVRGKEVLTAFKTLQLIVSKDKSFSNVQFINNKAQRVISVDMEKYKLLKNLNWERNK